MAVLIRHSLKYKITVSQKTSYRHRTSDPSTNRINENVSGLKDFKGRKRSQVERRGERRQEKGAKRVALQTSPVTCRYLGITGLYPGPPEKRGLKLSPTRN